MRNHSSIRAAKQGGFTLIELVIVIVIIGILAAVAIPKFTSVSTNAYLGTQQATLGALKSAASGVYAQNKATATCTQAAAAMSPACTNNSGAITCPAVYATDGVTLASFTCTAAATGEVVPTFTCALTGC